MVDPVLGLDTQAEVSFSAAEPGCAHNSTGRGFACPLAQRVTAASIHECLHSQHLQTKPQPAFVDTHVSGTRRAGNVREP